MENKTLRLGVCIEVSIRLFTAVLHLTAVALVL